MNGWTNTQVNLPPMLVEVLTYTPLHGGYRLLEWTGEPDGWCDECSGETNLIEPAYWIMQPEGVI